MRRLPARSRGVADEVRGTHIAASNAESLSCYAGCPCGCMADVVVSVMGVGMKE